MIGGHRKFEDRMLLLTIFYQGPWDRLSNWCYGIRKGTEELRWDIPAEPKGIKWVLMVIGDWAEKRDKQWRAKFAVTGREPRKLWNRRPL
jgi:hypothetical protein